MFLFAQCVLFGSVEMRIGKFELGSLEISCCILILCIFFEKDFFHLETDSLVKS